MKKLTQDQFIAKCECVHRFKYDYSKVKYVNTRTKVIIVCNEHGEFSQLPKSHYNGQGCPFCYGDINIDKNHFITKYGRKDYDYSLLKNPFRIKSYIKVINKTNGLTYVQLADHHKRNINPSKIESNSLIKKLKEMHDDKFDYIIEKETYYSTDRIKIIHKQTKDEFYYRVDRHLSGMKPNKVTLNYFLLKSNKKFINI
jgi:hypothetical protein